MPFLGVVDYSAAAAVADFSMPISAWVLLALLLFALGASIGSFLNVCIYRIPEKRSIVSPPSECESCGARLKWYDMIPVFSALWLRGHCRNCGASFSMRHAWVELMTGIIYVAAPFIMGFSMHTAHALFLISIFIITSFTDIDRRIIPNKVVLVAIIGSLIFMLLEFFVPGTAIELPNMDLLIGLTTDRVLSAIAIFTALMAVSLMTGALGAGDAKLGTLFGLYFGSLGVMVALFGFMLAGIYAFIKIATKKAKMTDSIAMAPFLGLTFLVCALAFPAR